VTVTAERRDTEEVGDIVRLAAAGDRGAWERLVARYVGLVWASTREFRLSESDRADVSQTTWLRLLENIDRLEDPERVGSWLATTAWRESLRVAQLRRKVTPTGDEDGLVERDRHQAAPDESLLSAERADDVRAAVRHLPPQWQSLLWLLVSDPPLSYREIADRLGVPIGSIGPTRGRCLERLRPLLER
jgi:RNA polymerase sigma factor (sigma-70 family)